MTMATFSRPGQGTITYTHPRELVNVYPSIPKQPLASWADDLAAFQAALVDTSMEMHRRVAEACGVLVRGHMFATTADIPSGEGIDPLLLAKFKTHMPFDKSSHDGHLLGAGWFS